MLTRRVRLLPWVSSPAGMHDGVMGSLTTMLSQINTSLEMLVPRSGGNDSIDIGLTVCIEPSRFISRDYFQLEKKLKRISVVTHLPLELWATLDESGQFNALGSAAIKGIASIRDSLFTVEEKRLVTKVIEDARNDLSGGRVAIEIPLEKNVGVDEKASSHLRLYRADAESFRYHEAWVQGEKIAEHWGLVGEQGKQRLHTLTDPSHGFAALTGVLAEVVKNGFSEWADDQYERLFVVLKVSNFANANSNQNTLEKTLNRLLGWRGLGWCDGTSIGSGKMDLLCMVCSVDIARRVIDEELSRTEFRGKYKIADDSEIDVS